MGCIYKHTGCIYIYIGIIGIPIKILLLPVFVDNVDKRLGYVYLHSRTQSLAHTQGSGNSRLSASSDWLITAT